MEQTQQFLSIHPIDEETTEVKINFKKHIYTLWQYRQFVCKIFFITLFCFISLTFILPKKWKVEADLYINKANSSNYAEINPFALEELGSMTTMLSNNNPLADELELLQSRLVIEKVIEENNLVYKKFLGLIPTKKTGDFWTVKKFLKKNVSFENKKGTSIITISYKSKNKELAYNVVNSLIKNYIELHKELNSEKSKSDKKIIEDEYNKAKSELNKKVNAASGIPTNSMTGTGNLAALSAFSRSAQEAMSLLKGQYIAGEKSRVDITESASKVSHLSQKLEWAKLVEEMSDSSKVLVISEPTLPKSWEYVSPKLLINILLGTFVGILFALFGLIYKNITSKSIIYSMLGDNVIYNLENEFDNFSSEVISNSDKKTAFVFFEELPKTSYEKFKDFKNIVSIKADITNSFNEAIKNVDNVVTYASIGKTSSKKYKLVKKMISNLNKKIIYEVLI